MADQHRLDSFASQAGPLGMGLVDEVVGAAKYTKNYWKGKLKGKPQEKVNSVSTFRNESKQLKQLDTENF